jgi:uroporphyrinogen III methyltransferase/synthase
MHKKGKVYLVGAGPGRADLITLRGIACLKMADCVIYDKLVNPALLAYAGAQAEKMPVPKRVYAGSVSQDTINELLVTRALAGKTVVRLKGGDPCMFGRVAEEMRALQEHGIDFEIVPGITSGIAAGAYSGIMITDRDLSSQVVFITGHEADGKEASGVDWELLARIRATLVFYMGIGNLPVIVDNLVQHGLDPDTPGAVVANATWPTQKTVTAPVASLVQQCAQEDIEPPAIIIIGRGAAKQRAFAWFTALPLCGQSILVTRDRQGNMDFSQRIIEAGGNPIALETIALRPITDTAAFVQCLAGLGDFHWIVFTSANGVRIFFQALERLGRDARVFGKARIAAVGPATAGALNSYAIAPDFVPRVFTTVQLGLELVDHTNLHEKSVLLLRSKKADTQVVELLEKAGARVVQTPLYAVESVKADCEELMAAMDQGHLHWITFASPSAVSSFCEQIPLDRVKKAKVRIASIGPVTSQRCRDLGLGIDVEASTHTLDGLLDAIKEALA